MSKNDELRRMREARYARDAARAGARTTSPRATPPVAPSVKPAAARAGVGEAAASGGTGAGLCGHRSMNGRACTREHGHSAKNHRYS